MKNGFKFSLISLLFSASICLTSCDFSSLFNDDDDDETIVETNTSKNEEKTSGDNKDKKDDTKQEDEKQEDEKTPDEDKETPVEDDKKEYYTATFYSDIDVVYKEIKVVKGEAPKYIDSLNENRPSKPVDEVKHEQFIFNDRWQVISDCPLKDQKTINNPKNDDLLFAVDYDISYLALYVTDVQDCIINFYNSDGSSLVSSIELYYGYDFSIIDNSTMLSIFKNKFKYKEPFYIVEGKYYPFVGWSSKKNASVNEAIELKDLPKVSADTSYFAIFDLSKATDVFIFFEDYGNYKPLSYETAISNEYIKVSNNVLQSINDGALGKYGGNYHMYFSKTNIKSIADAAFKSAWYLKEIDLGNVTTIGAQAFDSSYTQTVIGNNVTSIGEGCFKNCGIKNITLPNITSIPSECFASSGLEKYEVPNKVTSIGARAFGNSKYLNTLTISASVTSIEEPLFYFGDSWTMGIHNVENIIINSNNKYFKTSNYNGAIIDNNNNLIAASKATKIIPSYVEIIKSYAFYCLDMTEITIPSSVTSIKNRGFLALTNVKVVNYQGTKAKLKSICASKESLNFNADVIFKCIDGEYTLKQLFS